MLEVILSTLGIMGWLGIVLGIFVIVNTVCGTVTNVSNGESFSFKKMFKGLGKAGIFYLSAVFASVATTMLPYINEMIANSFGTMLISTEILSELSSVGVLGISVAAIVSQAQKALKGIKNLSQLTLGKEEITWEVKDE